MATRKTPKSGVQTPRAARDRLPAFTPPQVVSNLLARLPPTATHTNRRDWSVECQSCQLTRPNADQNPPAPTAVWCSHNPKVAGSNPAPATNERPVQRPFPGNPGGPPKFRRGPDENKARTRRRRGDHRALGSRSCWLMSWPSWTAWRRRSPSSSLPATAAWFARPHPWWTSIFGARPLGARTDSRCAGAYGRVRRGRQGVGRRRVVTGTRTYCGGRSWRASRRTGAVSCSSPWT